MFQKSLLTLLFFIPFLLPAQEPSARIAPTDRPLSEVEMIVMPAVDNEALLAEEMERRGPGIAPRFAKSFELDIRPETHGNWERIDGGIDVWRLRVRSATAKSLNLGFTEYYMPPGGSLILYAPDSKRVLGPFTPADNEAHQQLWTPVLNGEELVIEVRLPAERRNELQLWLTSVNHDFLGFNSIISGSCNLDVVCGEDDGWPIVDLYRDIIQSVAVYSTGGNTFCTGFLINNARQDCTPYFMTAFHCGIGAGSAPSLVVFWNYQNSTCRQPGSPESGGPGDGALNDFNTGAEFRSGYSPSDVTLVELDDPVSETADAFFAGWNRTTALPTDTTICVHHPSTDEKRISFEFDPTYLGNWPGDTPNPNGNHIIVADWDIGTTEGGSSGSPLFNKKKQVVGQLHGGSAACSNDLYDSYGWFHTSWNGGGTPSTRLSDWLDPDGTGITELDGASQQGCGFFVDALIPVQEICAPEDAIFELVVSPNFENAVTITIDEIPAGLTADLESNPVAPGDTITLTITDTDAVAEGSYSIVFSSTDGISSDESTLTLGIVSAVPDAVLLISPIDGATDISTFPTLSWDGLPANVIYEVVVSINPDLSDPAIELDDVGLSTIQAGTLEPSTTYYWRVRATNICGTGEWSDVFSFTTSECSIVFANDGPVPISNSGTSTVTSTIEVTSTGLLQSLRLLDANITHSWVGDLSATLTAPDGTSVLLFDRPGVPASNFGCSEDNMLVTFYDDAPLAAGVLEATCSGGGTYAISGDYQSIDPLSVFEGIDAAGTWTLTVTDNFGGDGGAINGWGLELCTQNTPVLDPLTSALNICVGETASFDLSVGSAFSGPVDLSAQGVPMGATVAFSENPADPGSTVTVTVSGFNIEGLYPIELTGAFDSETATATVPVSVVPLPAAPELLAPADEQTGVSLSPLLDWVVAADAQSYVLTVATDPDLQEVVLQQTLNLASFSLAGLAHQTTYYWQVEAQNDCGGTLSSVFSFTTLVEISLSVTPESQTVCTFESPDFTMQVSGGFAGPVVVSYTVEPAADLTVDYDMDPANVPPGSTVTATIGGLVNVAPGTYNLTFDITDGSNATSDQVILIVEAQPEVPSLLLPQADALLSTDQPAFSWDTADNTDEYRLEIATDAQFNNVIRSVILAETDFALTDPLNPGDYFWRITALNACGGSTSSQRAFRIETNSTEDLAGRTVRFEPNPTSGLFYVRLSGPLPGAIDAEVFSLNGQLLLQKRFAPAASVLSLDLSGQPGGVYIVRLRHEGAMVYRRVVVD